MIKSKQYAHTRKSDKAKDKGTLAHAEVEKFIKKYIETKEYVFATGLDEEVQNSVDRFFSLGKRQ